MNTLASPELGKVNKKNSNKDADDDVALFDNA
jgi:hypothetical protein